MINAERLRLEAHHIPLDERRAILTEIPEVELHPLLGSLFRAMSPDAWVEVTHGTTEYGKDLVVIRHDPLLSEVIGVVVKRGDIRGKTAGDVDSLRDDVNALLSAKGERITREIVSQIRQAKEHTAALSAHVRELKVTNVMVVLVGEFSGNARKRLELEVGSLAGLKDLPWLVDAFTDYYPQVYFEARAIDFLYDTIESLDQDSFHAKSGKTLSECYVEPALAPMDTELSFDDATKVAKVRRRRRSFPQLAASLTPKSRVLLVGDPGSGKSKVVAKYCIDACRSAINRMTRREDGVDAVKIPLMLSARHLLIHRDANALLDQLLPQGVRDRLSASALVVDGLDEVPSSERVALLETAERYATELGIALVVTSRRLAVIAAAPRGFSRYEILPFEFGQAMKLVNKVLVSKDVLPALKAGMQKIQAQLPMNPLSLILLIEVVAERKEVPASLTELYERFLDLVFGRWDKDKGIEVLFEYVVKKRFLASLAYNEFFQKQRLEIPQEDFESFVREYSATYGWDADELRNFIKEVERAGVLETQAEVFFRHRSFLDFFVGHHLYEQRDRVENLTETITELYYDALWSEAAFFYTGLGRELSEELLDGLCKYSDNTPDLPFQKLFVGRLLQAGWHSPTAIKARGVRLALDYVPATVEESQKWLSTFKKGMPRLVSELTALALSKHALGSFAVQQEAAALLEELEGTPELTKEGLLKRAALLWALEEHLEAKAQSDATKRFIADVTKAELGTLDEARLLLLAGLSDPATEVRKIIGRRIRRIEAETPNALATLIPGRKRHYSPPPERGR